MSDGLNPIVRKILQDDPQVFRKLAETASCAIFMVRREGFLYLNPAALAMAGYTEEEMMSLGSWAELLHPDDREYVVGNAMARFSGKDVERRYEFRIITKNGEERWLDYTADRIELASGPAILATAFDITDRKRAEEKIKASERELATILDNMQDTFYRTDTEGRLLVVSPSVKLMLGYVPEEVLGKNLADYYWRPEERALFLRKLQEQGGVARNHETLMRHKDGRCVCVLTNARIYHDADGRPRGVEGTSRDITERKQAEEALHREKELAQVTLESIGDGVVTTDVRGCIEYLNPVAEELSGWTLAEAYGRPFHEVLNLIDESGRAPVPSPIDTCLSQGRSTRPRGQPLLIRKGGRAEFSLEVTASPICNREGSVMGAVLIFHDVTELRGMARQLSYQATHDDLTGLINRREFEERLESALREAKQGGRTHVMCYLDLDQFKVVNDTCGHVAGDELLKQLGSELQELMRDDDTLARLGGDEFGILLQGQTLKDGQATIEAVHQCVNDFRFFWEDKVYEVGASIGVVSIDVNSGSVTDVLRAVDSACYVAKDQGRNRIHVFQADDIAIAQRHGEMQWLQRISKAFEEKRFMLYYQRIEPLSASAREAGSHCELLLRMVDEHGSPVLPRGFISAAERYQLMPTIDRWVIRAAIDALSRTEVCDLLDSTTCAINLSGQSLGDDSFLEFVTDQFRRTTVDPAQICFEITETAAIANIPRAMHFINELKRMGCRFSLDDFGRGLSSFAYLKSLPVDFLKIDGSFVRDLVHDPIDYAMVEAINQIGHVMGIYTIAESVESEAALKLVNDIGVDYVQGSRLARPAPIGAPVPAPDPLLRLSERY